MNLFIKTFSVVLILFGETLVIGIGQYRERFGLFKGSSSTSIVDICNCLRIRSLKGAFDGSFRGRRPQPQ